MQEDKPKNQLIEKYTNIPKIKEKKMSENWVRNKVAQFFHHTLTPFFTHTHTQTSTFLATTTKDTNTDTYTFSIMNNYSVLNFWRRLFDVRTSNIQLTLNFIIASEKKFDWKLAARKLMGYCNNKSKCGLNQVKSYKHQIVYIN